MIGLKALQLETDASLVALGSGSRAARWWAVRAVVNASAAATLALSGHHDQLVAHDYLGRAYGYLFRARELEAA